MKVLFVLSTLLGNKSYSFQLMEIVETIDWIEPKFIFYDDKSYKIHRSNKFKFNLHKLINFRTRFRDKINIEFDDKFDFDVIFIQGYDLIDDFSDLIELVPTIVAHDTTDILSHQLTANLKGTKISRFISIAQSFFTRRKYTPIIDHIKYFLPRTSWAASSLQLDYNVHLNKITPTPGYLDLDAWLPTVRTTANLLFVGNDFERKGGFFLLEIYEKYLSNMCSLTIVSNDEALGNMPLPVGVKLIQSVQPDQKNILISIYQDSSIFIFPTFYDQLGLVLKEACAVGLPIVSRDVGGVSELVKDGENGYLLSYDSSPEQWRDKIVKLITRDDLSRKMGANSRLLAEKYLSAERYKQVLIDAFNAVMNV
jgi:glycosyltransferase involved in cell wall biosynthesis